MGLGVEPKNAFVLTNGDVLEIDSNGARVGEKVQSGVVYVDGLGVGDVSQSVMRDRWSIGSDGIFLVVVTIEQRTGAIVAGPRLLPKGVVPRPDAPRNPGPGEQRGLRRRPGGPAGRAPVGPAA